MTISNSIRTAGPYPGNGVTTVFPFSFKVFAEADVVALLSGALAETQLVLNSGYTVALNADQNLSPGGSVTVLGTPVSSAQTLTLTSDVDELQGTALTNQGGFYPKVIEDAFDRATILIQQLRASANRSLRFPLSDTGLNAELPVRGSRANNLLGFDAAGNPVAVAIAAQSATALQSLLATSGGAALVGSVGGLTVEQRLAAALTEASAAAGGLDNVAVGVPLPGVSSAFMVTDLVTTHARYAFIDNSTITYAVPGFYGHASFNDNVKITGAQNTDHHHSFQSYPHYGCTGTLGRLSGFWCQPDVTAGAVTELSQFKASNALGAGGIFTQYGFYCEPLTRGNANYAIYVAGTTVSYFGGALVLGQIANPAYVKYNTTSGNLDLIPRTGYGVNIDAELLFGAATGSPAKINYNVNGNLDITSRTGFHTTVKSGSLLVGTATIPAAGEKFNVTAPTVDYIARMYNSDAASPKGLALIYSAAAPNSVNNEFLYCQDSLAVRAKIQSNGNLVNVNNSYGAISDVKLKENIADATPKLDKLLQVRIVSYNLKTDPDQKQLGVIAQELEKLFPGMVEETPDFEDVEIAPARVERVTTQRHKTVQREEIHMVPTLVDGQWRNVPTPIMVDVQAFDEFPMFDEHGAPLMEIAELERTEVRDADDKIITPYKPAVYSDRQRIHQIPVMEDLVTTTKVPAKIERRATGTVTKSVKYSVFVPMLIKAIQELDAKLSTSKAKRP